MQLIRNFAIVAILLSALAEATDIRGRVDGYNINTQMSYPLVRISVDLFFQWNNSWQHVGRYITGPDGMYYFQNLRPGYYVLQVNGRYNYPINIYNQRYQDLPPIVLKY